MNGGLVIICNCENGFPDGQITYVCTNSHRHETEAMEEASMQHSQRTYLHNLAIAIG